MMDMFTKSLKFCDYLRQAITGEVIDPRALKSRHNELAPISRLHCELLVTIFSFLSISAWDDGSGLPAWIYIAHVCCRWRETVLNHLCFWSHVNLSDLTPVGIVEVLSRAKMAPLDLEADSLRWNMLHRETFEWQLETHISHTRHLKFSGYRLSTMIERLVSSPTPILESLSLSYRPFTTGMVEYTTIPDNLFNCTAPSLTSLKLNKYDISWKSPLLKGLRILEIREPSAKARPKLDDWLDALNEMSQLKDLSLQSASPVARRANPLVSRAVTLPSLTHFSIDSSADDCALALAHLVLPALARLHVVVKSQRQRGRDVLLTIPYVARNIRVLQDIKPIRSILIDGRDSYIEVLTWTVPGADVKVHNQDTLCNLKGNMSSSASFLFVATGISIAAVADALFTHLPMNFVSSLTALNNARLSKEFWISYAPQFSLLEQARLYRTSAEGFWKMLAEDTPSDGPRLPSLTRLILPYIKLNALRTYHLRNMLIKRREQGIPLKCLDFNNDVLMRFAPKPAIQLLAEVVVDMQEPLDVPLMEMDEFFDGYGGICYDSQVEFDDRQGPLYCDIQVDNSVDEDGDDEDDDNGNDEDGDDGDDEGGDDGDYGDGGGGGTGEGEGDVVATVMCRSFE
jgi:hypothetical protein